MFFASLVRRLVRGSDRGPSSPSLQSCVPQLTLLEGRALPSGNPGLGAVPPLGPALASEVTVSLPFKLTGGGPAPGGLPLVPNTSGEHFDSGTAAQLGKYTGAGEFTLGSLDIDPDTGAVTGTFQGTYVFTAANGDKLVVTYGDGFSGTFTGQLSADGSTVLNLTFDAMFTADPESSTGRFEGTTGSFRMIATAEPISLASDVQGFTAPFNYTWVGEGTLEFQKGKK